jgi:lipid-A-disaccharide synthase
MYLFYRAMRTVDRISLVNLLAGEDLYPEYAGVRCHAPAIAEHVLHWLNDPSAYEALRDRLARLKAKVAEPGACGRAAACILSSVRDRVA